LSEFRVHIPLIRNLNFKQKGFYLSEGKVYIYLTKSYRVGDKVKTRKIKSYGQLDLLEKEEAGG